MLLSESTVVDWVAFVYCTSGWFFGFTLLLIPQLCLHRSRLGLIGKTGQTLVYNNNKQQLSANLQCAIGSASARSVQNRDSPFSWVLFPFSVVSRGPVAKSTLNSSFSSRSSDNLRKTSALRAVRAHSVQNGPDMHCYRFYWPIRNVPALLFQSRSLAMRTKLGDQQYRYRSRRINRAECLGRSWYCSCQRTYIKLNVTERVLSSARVLHWTCTYTGAHGDSSSCTPLHSIVVCLVFAWTSFAYL